MHLLEVQFCALQFIGELRVDDVGDLARLVVEQVTLVPVQRLMPQQLSFGVDGEGEHPRHPFLLLCVSVEPQDGGDDIFYPRLVSDCEERFAGAVVLGCGDRRIVRSCRLAGLFCILGHGLLGSVYMVEIFDLEGLLTQFLPEGVNLLACQAHVFVVARQDGLPSDEVGH